VLRKWITLHCKTDYGSLEFKRRERDGRFVCVCVFRLGWIEFRTCMASNKNRRNNTFMSYSSRLGSQMVK
jgi:hypothetical protein